MLPRSQRLTSAQFNHAFAHSQSVRHPLVALKAHWRGDDSDAVRAAFVVPKKQARAVGRNRTRRRLRERYRLHPRRDELRGYDLIFLTTPATHDALGAQLDEALDEVLRRMKSKLGANSGAKRDTPESSRLAGIAASNRERRSLQAGSNAAVLPPSSPLEFSANQRLEEGASPALVEPAINQITAEPNPIAAPVSVFVSLALAAIRFYQRFISPGLPPSCRFYPSCSRYTYGAIERFGLARGLWLGSYRVCRCHPWNAGGVDEVPEQFPPLATVRKRTFAKTRAFFMRRRFDSPRN